MRATLAFTLALVGLAAAPVRAQQIKPYFLVVFDTSTSMILGSTLPNTCAGFPENKFGAAKCALGKLINSTGEAEFGLMHFAQTVSGGSCTPGTCSPVAAAATLRIPIQTNTAAAIGRLIDNSGTPGNATDDELCVPPVNNAAYTPLGGTLLAARQYFEGSLGGFAAPTAADSAVACRPLAVILLTDGVECCSNCTNSGAFDDGCPDADADLDAAGLGACSRMCADVGDANLCSAGDAYETAPQRAWELRRSMVPAPGGAVSKAIQTYVIGFGISPGNVRIERIAVGGGTDNPADGAGGLRAFYANDDTALSLAFNQIIADAQPPNEICNGLDDDCDGAVDEELPFGQPGAAAQPSALFCDGEGHRSAAQNDQVRARPDYSDTLAQADPIAPPARVVCGRVVDNCDNPGVDDDCDGAVDEDGVNACGTCGPLVEICDGLDNDCDGTTDENTDGGPCGSSVGRCKPGTLRCVSGDEQCLGGIDPRAEVCNCQDDDCDGTVDEDVDPDNPLCPDGACVACECVPRCQPSVEFTPTCPQGLTADTQPSGECLCIVDQCDREACAGNTLMRDGEVACAPDDPQSGPCLCKAGQCIARCDGVSCGFGEICDKRSGRCAENNCRGLGCPEGQLCDALDTECVVDACNAVSCQPGEACRSGTCEPSCALMNCKSGQYCKSGVCKNDPCAAVRCSGDTVCEPERGACVAAGCNISCGTGLVCSLSSGECERDPCWDVHCPDGQTCARGECRGPAGPSAGTGGGASQEDRERILAAGGGGCSCRITAGPGERDRRMVPALLVALCLGAARVGRRRRGSRVRLGLWLACALGALLLALSGCKVTPFCADCGDTLPQDAATGSGGVGGGSDLPQAGTGDEDGGTDITPPPADAGAEDGGLAPGCKTPKEETCDGKDEDCDFKVDEDTETPVNDCIQAGVCAGSKPVCLSGKFICRYPDEREVTETDCDGIDSDCDGRVDETFTTLGAVCQVGEGACEVSGTNVCNEGGNGVRCEVTQSAPAPSAEICDGVDNDCDGLTDEPSSAPGSDPSFVHDSMQQTAANVWMYSYEAARPDATATLQGIVSTRACSRANVMPWTNVTYPEADAACQAAGLRLCTADEWQAACAGTDGCVWSYTNGGCDAYPQDPMDPGANDACNGHSLMSVQGGPDLDALAATGSHPNCFSANQGGNVFDLSGNAKEWTSGTAGSNPLRGGSYEDLPGGLRCDFTFPVGGDMVRVPTIGFRCCGNSAP